MYEDLLGIFMRNYKIENLPTAKTIEIVVHPFFLNDDDIYVKKFYRMVLVNGPNINTNKMKRSLSYRDKISKNVAEKLSVAKAKIAGDLYLVTIHSNPDKIIVSPMYSIPTKEVIKCMHKEMGFEKAILSGEIFYDRPEDDIGCVNTVRGILKELGIQFEIGNTKSFFNECVKYR